MALEQQKIAEATQDNMNVAIGGVMLASQNMQAIASELVQMSLESVDNATQVVDRFSKAKNWDQILEVQNKFLKSSLDTFAQHGAKMAELMTALPSEMGKNFQRLSKNMTVAGGTAMRSAAEQGGAMSEAIRPDAH